MAKKEIDYEHLHILTQGLARKDCKICTQIEALQTFCKLFEDWSITEEPDSVVTLSVLESSYETLLESGAMDVTERVIRK